MSGSIAASVAVFLALWLALSAAISLLWVGVRRPLNRALNSLRATSRANCLRLIGLLPVSCSAALAAGLFEFPDWLIAPHCHPLQCATHSPNVPLSAWTPLLLAAALLPAAVLLIVSIRRTRQTARQWHALSTAGDGFRILDASLPIACALGFIRPDIYLSRGLIERLPATAVATIAAHERAHVWRNDNLWLLLIRLSCLFWIGRNTLFDDIELAHDQACDRAAANVVGDTVIVAETLLQCRRLTAAPAFSASFLRGHIAARVESILNDQQESLASTRKVFLCSLLILAIAAAVPTLHNLLELF